MSTRPPFIVSAADVPERRHRYPNSEEEMAPYRAIGQAAGMLALGIRLVRVLPGTRTSYPHAESAEEEFAYVIEGELDAWVDGELHRLRAGDLIAFPAGTGICHTLINDGERDALLLAGGEADKACDRIVYPRNPERRADMPWSRWWSDAPQRSYGSHDGRPRRTAR
jgi:uncharacterized cupin superfamily protein